MASVSRPSCGPTIETPQQPRSFLSQNGHFDATRALPHRWKYMRKVFSALCADISALHASVLQVGRTTSFMPLPPLYYWMERRNAAPSRELYDVWRPGLYHCAAEKLHIPVISASRPKEVLATSILKHGEIHCPVKEGKTWSTFHWHPSAPEALQHQKSLVRQNRGLGALPGCRNPAESCFRGSNGVRHRIIHTIIRL